MESYYVADSFGFFARSRVEIYGDADEFQNIWNTKANNYDVVVIDSHADPEKLEEGVMPNSKYKCIRAKVLILLGCNAGHSCYKGINLAHRFSQYVWGKVVASDGTVHSNHMQPKRNQIFKSLMDEEWKKFCYNLKEQRKRRGWGVFKYFLGFKLSKYSYKYEMTVNQLLRLAADPSRWLAGTPYYCDYVYTYDSPIMI